MLRAHIRLGRVGPFIGRLREVIGRIDKELWPEDDSRKEIEGLMTRLEDVPSRVQAWKKSAARCGAYVVLSLVRVHCKEAREEKLKTLQVANTKKLRFEDFMQTFLDTATRIADGIDLLDGLGFDPFGKLVDCYQQMSESSLACYEWSDCI